MQKRICVGCLLFLLGVLLFQLHPTAAIASDAGESEAKTPRNIAVAAIGNTQDAEISRIAARASYFLIFDRHGVFSKAIANPARSRDQRASWQLVDLLIKESCGIVIAGNFGGRMRSRLQDSGIEFFERDGIAKEAVRPFVKKP